MGVTHPERQLLMVADSPSEQFNANVVDSTNSPPIAESWCLTQVKVISGQCGSVTTL